MTLKDHLKKLARKYRQHPPIRLKHHDRSYIVELCAQFGLTRGAEIGVAEGRFSEEFCKKIPDIKLFCIDTWAVGDDHMSINVGAEKAEKRYQEAKKRLAPYNASLIRTKSMDIVRDFEPETLDFVYIDACHDFDYVMQDIIEWSKRVKKGGIVAGHDYYKFTNSGVIEAVDAYIKCHRINLAFITNELTPSFFWIKQ